MTLLLAEIPDDLNPFKRETFSQCELSVYSQAKKEFLQGFDLNLCGADMVEAIYNRIDKINLDYQKDHQIFCQSGCAWCCCQLVCCTTSEMKLIVKFLKQAPRKIRRELIKRIKKEAFWLNHLLQMEKAKLAEEIVIPRWEYFAESIKYAYLGRPCVFLSAKDKCLIYSVRPIDCRITKSDRRQCGPTNDQNLPIEKIIERSEKEKQGFSFKSGVRLFADQVASDLISEEEIKISGTLSVVPLAYWPLTEQFHRFFFP